MAARRPALVEHVDRYNMPSRVGHSGIFLATSSSAATGAPFFRGYLAMPRRTADLALVLAHVVRTRFYTPPGMLERLIAQRDPVITCGGGILRLEGFSACCGVYARLDLREEAFDADRMESGTSNVDFNPTMRAALAKLNDGERAMFEVSAEGFTLTPQSSEPAFERRVKLPVRWMKGFVEVQAHQSRMERRFQISGVMGQRFLRNWRVRVLSLYGSPHGIVRSGSATRESRAEFWQAASNGSGCCGKWRDMRQNSSFTAATTEQRPGSLRRVMPGSLWC